MMMMMMMIGMTMEAIEQNPVVYELVTDLGWVSIYSPIDDWLTAYARQVHQHPSCNNYKLISVLVFSDMEYFQRRI